MEYICKYCGKIFNDKRKLAGHATHCKLNPNYEVNLKKCKQNISKANNKTNKSNELHNDLFCIYCGKQFKNLNSLKNHERLCKENPNRQISPFVAYNKECTDGKRVIWNKGLTADTDSRVKQQSITISTRFIDGLVSSFKGKHHSKESKQKLSIKRKQYLLDNPEKVPYKLNHHSKQSYPEKYFREVFDNDDLLKTAISEFRVKLYSLDFAFPDIKFYIEIDGEQHYTDSRIVEHDKKRNLELEKMGWKSIRIRWSEYNKKSLEEKQEFIKYIKASVAQLVP